MHFDTFYQFFIYSKNWAYIMMFITLPLFVVFWNTILYPTQDMFSSVFLKAYTITLM